MQLESETQSDALVITVNEQRIDAACAVQFKDRIRELAGSAPKRIILDLGSVEFVDSSGLGAIVGAMKQAKPDHSLELAALTPTVQKVFSLTRLDRVFAIHESAGQAISSS